MPTMKNAVYAQLLDNCKTVKYNKNHIFKKEDKRKIIYNIKKNCWSAGIF